MLMNKLAKALDAPLAWLGADGCDRGRVRILAYYAT